MDVAIIGAAAAIVAIPIALIQWLSLRAQARSAEVDLLRAMRSDWLALKPQWHRAILTAIGPDDYYSPADLATRETFRRLVQDIVADPEIGERELQRLLQETRDRSHEFEQAERDVLFFLAALASAVFRGRLSAGLAYTAVGLDVTPRSRQIRVLLGEASADWLAATADEEGETASCPWDYWVDSIPGLTDRILGLLDVLWAEAARRHDIQTDYLVEAARVKREFGSGLRNRRRVRRLAREHGSRATAWRLERSLLAGEFLRLGPPRRIHYPEREFIPPGLRGWGVRGRARTIKAFVSGRLRRTPKGETVPSDL